MLFKISTGKNMLGLMKDALLAASGIEIPDTLMGPCEREPKRMCFIIGDRDTACPRVEEEGDAGEDAVPGDGDESIAEEQGGLPAQAAAETWAADEGSEAAETGSADEGSEGSADEGSEGSADEGSEGSADEGSEGSADEGGSSDDMQSNWKTKLWN